MSYVDAHLHLADPRYADQIQDIIDDATENRVTRLLSNAIDYETSVDTLEITKRHDPIVLAAIGVHPWTATTKIDCQLDKFERLIKANESIVKAVGEIGLDGKYSRSIEAMRRQGQVFEFFLQLAERRRLPVIVHSRLAVNEVLETLTRFDLRTVLLHWYDGPIEKLRLIEDRGYLISIGPVTLYSPRTCELARKAGLGMILTETDGPVAYGGQFKGRMTKPSFVIDVVQKFAEIKSISMDVAQDALLNNFRKLVSA